MRKEIESLEKEIEKERQECIEDIKNKDKEYNQKNYEIKTLSNKYNENLEILKTFEKSLEINPKKFERILKKKKKSEEEMKKDLRIIDEQIKIY